VAIKLARLDLVHRQKSWMS